MSLVNLLPNHRIFINQNNYFGAAGGGGLDFSGLPYLPTAQRDRVETSAGDQDTIDSLALLDVWIDPYAPIFTDAAGTTAATTGDPVGNVLCYATGNSYTQPNAANQPTLASGPVLTGGYAKTLAGTPGATGTQKIIIATSDGILVADANLPASFTVPNIPNTRGIFAGNLSASDITRLKAYAIAEGAVDNNFAAITNFLNYFNGYSYLTSFPLIDTSSGTNFAYTWNYCSNLTSFPLIDTSSGTSFSAAWQNCSSLTSFPLIDVSLGTSFSYAWMNCSSLADFPANFFDGCLATNFTSAFTNTALTQASIDGILVSIESNGTSNGTFRQSGGNAPSATGEAAIDALRARGWTVTVEGGY